MTVRAKIVAESEELVGIAKSKIDTTVYMEAYNILECNLDN